MMKTRVYFALIICISLISCLSFAGAPFGGPTYYGSGSPEGNLSAKLGAVYSDTTTGTLYSKTNGSGAYGWAVVSGTGTGISADAATAIVSNEVSKLSFLAPDNTTTTFEEVIGPTGRTNIIHSGLGVFATNKIVLVTSSSTNTYSSLSAAASNAVPGSSILVYPGTYYDGANEVRPSVDNLSIQGIGNPTIIFSNGPVALSGNITNYYLIPRTGLLVDGLTIKPASVGLFSASIGSLTNSPLATNVVFKNCSIGGDSDAVYFNSTNEMHVLFENCTVFSEWDAFNSVNGINTNTTITIQNCTIFCDTVNSPSSKRGIRADGKNKWVVKNCKIRIRNGANSNIGVQVSDPPASVQLFDVNFDVAGTGAVDLQQNATSPDVGPNLYVGNLTRADGNAVNVGLGSGGPIYQSPPQGNSLILNIVDPTLGTLGGQMIFENEGNGGIVITNAFNQLATPAKIARFRMPDHANGAGLDVYGTISGNASGLTNVYSTNIVQRSVYKTNATDGVTIDATMVKTLFQTNASYPISGFSGLISGFNHCFTLTVSNSSASAIVVSNPPGAKLIGPASTNGLSIASGKEAYFTFDIWPNLRTNVWNTCEQ